MSKDGKSVIIVKKVNKGHHGHHGGAWKVAFADFMTAMMAFFMVMWIIGMDDEVKIAIEGYFQNPIGFQNGQAGTMSPLNLGGAQSTASNILPIQVVARQIEEQRYREIGERIEATLGSADGLGELSALVEVVLTDQGLRIELVEGAEGDTFFGVGASSLTPAASRAVQIISNELRATQAPVVVEGHTDAARYSSPTGYTNWELSADRANAARGAMERFGIGRERVSEIRGHADRDLRVKDDPYHHSNRRISILLPFTTAPGASITSGQPAGGLPVTTPASSSVPSGGAGKN